MSWVGFGGSRWRNLAAALVGLAAAGLIAAGGLTGRLGVAPDTAAGGRAGVAAVLPL